MCYDEGTLQAYMDGEFEGDVQTLVHHLSTCPSCRQSYDRLKFQELRIAGLLDGAFSDSRTDDVSTLQQSSHQALPPSDPPITLIRRLQHMHKSTKKWVAAAACVGIAASVFTFQPAMAESFLKLFRVNQIESVAISNKDLQDLETIFNKGSGKFDLKDLITVDVKTNGSSVSLEHPTAEELTAKLPGIHGFGGDVFKISSAQMEPARNVTMVLDVPKINEVLTGLGETLQLPEALNKKPVVLHFKETYSMNLIDEQKDRSNYAYLTHSTFPEIEISDEVDQDAFLKSLYAMNLLPENLKKQFLSLDHPSSSIPVPYNTEYETKETAQVDGINVIIINEKKGDSRTLYFSINDTLCVLNTNVPQEQAFSLIKELKSSW